MTTKLDPKAKAQELLRKSDTYSSPVDLDAVAKYLKIRVLYEEFEDNISGLLVVKNGKPAIGVNKNHHLNRQRFTIAHEIGHFVLHHRYSDDPKNNLHIDMKWAYFRAAEPGQKVDEQERQANQFAAELLMPKELLEQAIKRLALNLSDDTDFSKLASSLQVSEQALAIRLVDLKIGKKW